jgi:hypothetical protein
VRKNRVRADAHDLGIQAGKPSEVRLDCRQLVLSNRGEVQRVETDYNILSAIAGKLKFTLGLPRRAPQLEVWGYISNVHCHEEPPSLNKERACVRSSLGHVTFVV